MGVGRTETFRPKQRVWGRRGVRTPLCSHPHSLGSSHTGLLSLFLICIAHSWNTLWLPLGILISRSRLCPTPAVIRFNLSTTFPDLPLTANLQVSPQRSHSQAWIVISPRVCVTLQHRLCICEPFTHLLCPLWAPRGQEPRLWCALYPLSHEGTAMYLKSLHEWGPHQGHHGCRTLSDAERNTWSCGAHADS